MISAENLSFLKALKPCWECSCGTIRIGAFHGSPEDPLNGRVYPDKDISEDPNYNGFDFVFLGHTHHKMKKRAGDAWVINPGSLGQQRDGKGCSYLELDTESLQIKFHIVDYPVADLLFEIEQKDPGNKALIDVLLRKR